MLPISNSSDSAQINHIQNDITPSYNDSKIKECNNRDEAISYIKELTHNQFNAGNTLIYSDDDKIQLNTLECQDGEKQYYVTVNMPPNKFFYINNDYGHSWNINKLDIQDYQTKQVVFIFGADFPSDSVPVDMNLVTEKVEETNKELHEICYVHCNQAT